MGNDRSVSGKAFPRRWHLGLMLGRSRHKKILGERHQAAGTEQQSSRGRNEPMQAAETGRWGCDVDTGSEVQERRKAGV